MSSSGTESDSSASSDVDVDDYGVRLLTWTRIYGRRTQTNGRGSEKGKEFNIFKSLARSGQRF
jgi:hypothetical protein